MHYRGLAVGVLPMALAGCVTGDTVFYTRGDQTSTRIVHAVARLSETRNSTYADCWYLSGRAGGEDGLAGQPQACARAAGGFWWFLSVLVPERLTASTSIPLPPGADPEIVIRVPLPKIQGLHLRTTSGISPANELVRFEAGRGVWTFTLRVTPPSGAVESLEALLAYDAWPFDARDVRGVNLAPTCLTVSAGDVLLAATGFRLATRHPGDGSVNHPWGSERSINNVYYFSKLPHDQTGAISAPWQPSSRSIGTTDEDRAVSQTCGRK